MPFISIHEIVDVSRHDGSSCNTLIGRASLNRKRGGGKGN